MCMWRIKDTFLRPPQICYLVDYYNYLFFELLCDQAINTKVLGRGSVNYIHM